MSFVNNVFVVHPECCAQMGGNQQTVTLQSHQCKLEDLHFAMLPMPAQHPKRPQRLRRRLSILINVDRVWIMK